MMKEMKICVLSGAVLLFISIFKFSEAVNIYFSLVVATFLLTTLLFYKKPELANFKMVDILSVVVGVFLLYSLVFLLSKSEFFFVFPAAIVFFLYVHVILKETKGKSTSRKNIERDRLALRTGMYFDIKMRNLTEKDFNFSGLTKDLSTTGMKVFSQDLFNKDDQLYFRLYLPKESWPLTGEIKIVWKKSVDKGYEYGMVFTKISDRDRGKLAMKQGFSLLE